MEIVAHEDLAVIRDAGTELTRHVVVGPGEVDSDHRPMRPVSQARRARPRTAAEVAFIGVGPNISRARDGCTLTPETFLRGSYASRPLTFAPS